MCMCQVCDVCSIILVARIECQSKLLLVINYKQPMFVQHKLNMYILTVYSSFLSGSAFDHTELVLPVTRIVTELQWFGVCDDSAASIRLASIAVHPTAVANVPCNTTLLGSLSVNEHGISGQVYLVDRLTYAVLGFSYTNQGNDGTCMICF